MILDAGGRNTPTLLNAKTTLCTLAQAQLSYEVQLPIVVDMEPLSPGVSRQRGVSLSDNGPVQLLDGGGVRHVVRGQRNSTQLLVQNRVMVRSTSWSCAATASVRYKRTMIAMRSFFI